MQTAVKQTGGTPQRDSVGRARSEPDLSTYSGRVAARVRALREKRRMAVDDLADDIGVAVQTMYGYENGKSRIPTDLLPAFAKAFGMSVRAFLPEE